MHIVILCRDKTLYSVRRIYESAKNRNHSIEILDPYNFLLNINDGCFTFKYSNNLFNGADIFLPRLGAGISDHSLNLLKHLKYAGFPVMNSPESITIARDKINTLQYLALNDFPVPNSSFAPNPEFFRSALENVGGVPVIMKLPRSSQGKGVMKLSKADESESIADVMWVLEQDVIVQEFVPTKPMSDIRVLVLGKKVIGSVRRIVPKNEFRSNYNRGGVFAEFKLNDEIEDLGISVATVCGLEIAGIDFLETKNGFLILEVNASPGFKGIEEIYNNDVGSLIIEYIESIYK